MDTTSTKPTYSEAIESLTGFEKFAIKSAFDVYITELPLELTGHALVYVFKLREGLNQAKAKHASLSMNIKEIDDHFSDDEDESGEIEAAADTYREAASDENAPDLTIDAAASLHGLSESGKDGSEPV